MIRTLTLLAAILCLSVSASAQVTCAAFGQTLTLRAEGLSELAGDIIVNCQGGTVPAAGAVLPQFDVVVSLNANITSRILSAPATEALLFIDDPVPAAQLPCAPANGNTVCGPFFRGAGASSAALTQYNANTNPNPAPVNIFQGERQSDNTLVFRSIPLAAPGNSASRQFRIKLIRAAIAGASLSNGQLTAAVSFQNGPAELSLLNSAVPLGFVQTGFAVSARNAAGTGAFDTNAAEAALSRCVDWNRDLAGDATRAYNNQRSFTLRYTEGYAAAFKSRDINAPLADPPTLQQSDPQLSLGYDLFSVSSTTESGFFNANLTSINGLNRAGRTDSGTRLRAMFTGVPENVRVFVSAHSLRQTAYTCAAGKCTGGAASNFTAAYGVVAGATGANSSSVTTLVNPLSDAEVWDAGAGDPRALPAASPSFPAGARAGLIEVPIASGTGSFTWEIFAQDPLRVDSVSFAVSLAMRSGTAAAGTINVNGSGAPVSLVDTPSATAPLPRFKDTSTAIATGRIVDAACPLTLQAISPAAADAGSAGFELQVTGSGFTAQTVVRWNGSDRATTFLSGTSLRAQIVAGDLAQAGSANVTVFSAAAGASSSLPFTIRATGAGAPALISPADNASGMPLNTALSWLAPGTATVDVYFGASATPPFAATVTGSSYSPAGLAAGVTYFWRVAAGSATSPTWKFTTAAGSSGGLRFIAVAPCRLADTRAGQGTTGNFGPPALNAGVTRELPIPTSRCNIPATAKAYSLNVTVVPQEPLSYLTLWPTGQPQPLVSTLNSFHGGVVANAAVVPAGANGSVTAFVTNKTDLIVDINGYFDSTGGASFYTVDPCRLSDTRIGGGFSGLFGPPSQAGGTVRSYPLPSGPCGLPAGASAYSLNVTALPDVALSFLTIWPAGQGQPFVSTLNSFDGAVVANAALVPAGTGGAVSTFVTDATHTILDTNGYFAAPGGAGELQFYPVPPCRVSDTRLAGSGAPVMAAGSTREVAVAGRCGVPLTAKAYSVNVTVVPTGGLSFLTLWPTGKVRPQVSTLNSFLGRVVANAALVPAAAAGGPVSVFVTNETHVIVDVNGYFQ